MAVVDRWITDWEPSERFPYYTRANAGEVLPDPVSPLGWTLGWEGGLLPGWRAGNVNFGTFRPDELEERHPEVVGCFAGYFYVNLSATRMNGVRIPGLTVEAFDAAAFGGHPDVPPYQPHPDDECPECTAKVAEVLGWVMSASEWPELDEDRAAAEEARRSRPDLSAASPAELVARARSVQPLLERFFDKHVRATVSATVGPGILAGVTAALGEPTLAGRLIAAVGGVDSAAPSWALWRLSREVRASDVLTKAFDEGADGLLERLPADLRSRFDAFVVDHGSRGPNEWDLRSDTWETRPALALSALDRMRLAGDDESPQSRFDARKADREALTASLSERLAGDAETQGMLLAAIASAGRFMAWRERTKTNCVRALHEARMPLFELGRRAQADGILDDSRQIFMLLDAELDAFVADPASFRDVLAERAAGYAGLREIDPPFILASGIPPLAEWPRRRQETIAAATGGESLQGIPGSPGTARGRARVITDPADPSVLEPGDVLVAPITDPAWTPLFVPAAAVVVDTGAPISHAVIVSRELGLPCVVSVTGATARIPDGAMVEVNGDTGTVTVL